MAITFTSVLLPRELLLHDEPYQPLFGAEYVLQSVPVSPFSTTYVGRFFWQFFIRKGNLASFSFDIDQRAEGIKKPRPFVLWSSG